MNHNNYQCLDFLRKKLLMNVVRKKLSNINSQIMKVYCKITLIVAYQIMEAVYQIMEAVYQIMEAVYQIMEAVY